jgi:hypothetical protein
MTEEDPESQSCLVCGKEGEGVSREVDQEAAWFQEVIKEVQGQVLELNTKCLL